MFFILLFLLYLVNTNAYQFPSYGPFRWYGCHNLKPMDKDSSGSYIPSKYSGGRMIKSPDGLNYWSDYKTLESCRQTCYEKEDCVAYYLNTDSAGQTTGCYLARHCELLDKSNFAKTVGLSPSSDVYNVYYKDTFDDKTYAVYPSGFKFNTKEGTLQTALSNYTVTDCYRACAAQGANCKAFRYFFKYNLPNELNFVDNSYPGSCETYTKSTYKPYILDPEIQNEQQNVGKVYMSNLYVVKPPTKQPTTVPTKKPTQSSPTVPSSPTQSSPTVPSSPTQRSPTVSSQSNNSVMVSFFMILLLVMINTII